MHNWYGFLLSKSLHSLVTFMSAKSPFFQKTSSKRRKNYLMIKIRVFCDFADIKMTKHCIFKNSDFQRNFVFNIPIAKVVVNGDVRIISDNVGVLLQVWQQSFRESSVGSTPSGTWHHRTRTDRACLVSQNLTAFRWRFFLEKIFKKNKIGNNFFFRSPVLEPSIMSQNF